MLSVNNKSDVTEQNDINLKILIGELVDHYKLIIFIVSVFTLLACIWVLFATPVYQADALIQVEQNQGNALLSGLSQVLSETTEPSAPEIALLQSRMVLGKTVDDLNLQILVREKHFPLLGDGWARLTGQVPGTVDISHLYLPSDGSEMPSAELSVLDAEHYQVAIAGHILNGVTGTLLKQDGISILVKHINARPGTVFTISYASRLKAIKDLQRLFTVTDLGKDSGMLELILKGDDADLTVKILDMISRNYLMQNVAREEARDEKSLAFLNQQLPVIRQQLDQAEDKLNQYRKEKDSVDLSLEAKSVLQQVVNVDNQLNELTFRESEISQLYTPEHPTYQALLEKRRTLQEEKRRLTKQVSAMPSTQQEILRLSRDVESGRAVYMQLLNRQQELSIAKSSAIGNVRIVDKAVVSPEPVSPQKLLVIAAGIMFGIVAAGGVILLRAFLRHGIESPEQLEQVGISVYASISESETNSRRRGGQKTSYDFLALTNPADIAIEAIRGLQTSLHFAMMEATSNILMISGASPGAGKTFVSSNLAAIIASSGKRVLFIDADMRRGYVHELWDTGHEKGLSDILSGTASADSVIRTIAGAGFDFISRGQIPPNPAELLMHPSFGMFMGWAEHCYDLVIVDTPPILAVADAAIIGRHVGTTLLVARFQTNTVKEMEISIKRLEQSGVLVKGCVLNGIVKKLSNYYSYGYTSYGYHYKNENKKDTDINR